MTAFHWYEDTPTVISTETETVYINCTDEHYPEDEASQGWVEKARREDTPVVIRKRAALSRLAEQFTEVTLSVGLEVPLKGTPAEKEAALSEQLSGVITVDEWEQAVGAVEESLSAAAEGPIEELAVEEGTVG